MKHRYNIVNLGLLLVAMISCGKEVLLSPPATQVQPPFVFVPDPPHLCDSCQEWNIPQVPFEIFGSSYYVGTKGLSAILIAGDKGHILLDGGLTQSASQIKDNIESLGFAMRDVKYIVNSHAHYDHAGGIAALQRVSGAQVLACPRGAATLAKGTSPKDDPQYDFGATMTSFPKVAGVEAVESGTVIRLGRIALTAVCTPGHTPGAATWTWDDCTAAGQCEQLVYADSLSAVSAEGFRFSDTPGRVEAFEQSIAKVASLPCSILFVTHPGFINIEEKLAQRAKNPLVNPFVRAGDCQAYPKAKRAQLDGRIAEENAGD